MKNLEAHPIAAIFPSMTDQEYADLKADIAANGLARGIILYEGMILDGRHRYRRNRLGWRGTRR